MLLQYCILWEWDANCRLREVNPSRWKQVLQEDDWCVVPLVQDKWLHWQQVNVLARRQDILCQPSSIASYHGSVMSTNMICCWKPCYREWWKVVMIEEDCISHRGTTQVVNRPVTVVDEVPCWRQKPMGSHQMQGIFRIPQQHMEIIGLLLVSYFSV